PSGIQISRPRESGRRRRPRGRTGVLTWKTRKARVASPAQAAVVNGRREDNAVVEAEAEGEGEAAAARSAAGAAARGAGAAAGAAGGGAAVAVVAAEEGEAGARAVEAAVVVAVDPAAGVGVV